MTLLGGQSAQFFIDFAARTLATGGALPYFERKDMRRKFALVLMLISSPAKAHDWYPKESCEEHHCHPVDCTEIRNGGMMRSCRLAAIGAHAGSGESGQSAPPPSSMMNVRRFIRHLVTARWGLSVLCDT